MENKDVVQPVAENIEAQTLQPESIAGTAEEEIAQQTEQGVVEQVEQVAEQGYRPNKKQTTVAVLFVAAGVLSFLAINFGMLIPYGDIRMLLTYLPKVLFVLCWLLLAFMAVNKAAKVAAFIGAGAMAVTLLYYVPALMMNNLATCIVTLVMTLGISYAVCLIVRNCEMTWTNRTWVNLLALTAASSLAISLSALFIKLPDYTPMEHYVLFSPYVRAWDLLLVVLMAVANWKLARCEAFAGKYDAAAATDFNPVNKWTVMALVVSAVVTIALIVIHSNISWFINTQAL